MTPVPVITGVVIPGTATQQAPKAVFDWYQASFPGVDEDEFIGRYLADHDLASVSHYRGKTHGYERGYVIKVGDVTEVNLLCGGNQDAPLNAWASGQQSRGFADWSRLRFPRHYMTRGDGAIDINRPGAWSQLLDVHSELRSAYPRVSTSVVGDLFEQKRGMTLYFGSPRSEARARFYQKGLQLPEAESPHWCRAEIMVRPKGPQRQLLATQPADRLWSYTRWGRDAYQALRGFDPGQAVRETPRRTDLERRLAAMHAQYARTTKELRAMLTDEQFIEAIISGKMPESS